MCSLPCRNRYVAATSLPSSVILGRNGRHHHAVIGPLRQRDDTHMVSARGKIQPVRPIAAGENLISRRHDSIACAELAGHGLHEVAGGLPLVGDDPTLNLTTVVSFQPGRSVGRGGFASAQDAAPRRLRLASPADCTLGVRGTAAGSGGARLSTGTCRASGRFTSRPAASTSSR